MTQNHSLHLLGDGMIFGNMLKSKHALSRRRDAQWAEIKVRQNRNLVNVIFSNFFVVYRKVGPPRILIKNILQSNDVCVFILIFEHVL